MITLAGTDIRRSDPHRHKFADAMSEYLYDSLMQGESRSSGDTECPTGHFAQFGRRILCGDDRGFVWTETWPDINGATQVYDAMEQYYSTWADEGDDFTDEDAWEEVHATALGIADQFLAYVSACAAENLTAHDFHMWEVHNRPKGPLG